MKSALLIAVISIPLFGFQARVSGPVLGYVLDREAGGVRPMRGVPGAGFTGDALALGIDADRAAISSRAGFVLAASVRSGAVTLARRLGEEVETVAIEDAPANPDRIVLSPGGAAAALHYRDRNRVLLVAGLPDAPALRGEIDLSLLPGAVSSIAVGDRAESVLVSCADDQGESLLRLQPGGVVKKVASAGRISAVAYFSGSEDAAFADSGANAVSLLRDDSVVALPSEGIAAPVAVALSRDNRRVFVANRDSRTVIALDLAGGPPEVASCDCVPAALEPLEGDALFRLTEAGAERTWLLDGRAPALRVLFVPPAPARDPGGEQ